MKHLRHTITRTLLTAAASCLLATGGVSCGNGTNNNTLGSAQNNSPQPLLPPDTLALVEGLRLFEQAEYDLARGQLSASALSTSTYIRAESQLYLNALEMELGNYDAARGHLDRYHTETRRLLLESSRRMEQAAARLHREYRMFAGGMVALLMVGAVVFFVRRRRPQGTTAATESFAARASGTSGVPGTSAASETSGTFAETAPRFDISDWQRYLADAEAFKLTPVWDEISSLATQTPGRGARVLSLSRQEALDEELAVRFSDFTERLRADCPTLTAGDLKLCCLSLLPLSTFARALCFGSTETNIVKQRKHTIKKKLCADPRGRALFEFIFEGRG